jgi:hypothetical protein
MATDAESFLQFPCDFPIKIMGKSTSDFEIFVFTTLHKHFPALPESAIQQRLSKDGTYLAITVIVPATSKDQLDAVYRELTSNKEVLMAL